MAASSVGKLPRVLITLRKLRCRLSTAFVTGMKISVPRFGRGRRDRGVWCDQPGQRHREHEGAVKRVVIANPLQVKAIAHAHVKTDKVDAGTLASVYAAGYRPRDPDAGCGHR